MKLTNHQKLTLAVASVLAFGIWLFPHWIVHARHPAPGVRHYWYNAGYGFLFAPPRKVANERELSGRVRKIVWANLIQGYFHARMRRTEVRPICNRRAISDLLVPAR
jgi:hypothetical protein